MKPRASEELKRKIVEYSQSNTLEQTFQKFGYSKSIVCKWKHDLKNPEQSKEKLDLIATIPVPTESVILKKLKEPKYMPVNIQAPEPKAKGKIYLICSDDAQSIIDVLKGAL